MDGCKLIDYCIVKKTKNRQIFAGFLVKIFFKGTYQSTSLLILFFTWG